MARTSVKNMSRNQQKAVFANLGKGSTVSNMSARRQNLMHNDLATETHQDKVDRIMRNNRLTHRQKMDRISKLKNGSHSSGFSDSSVPVTSSSTSRVDSPGIKLIYQKVLDKAEKRRLARKAYLKDHPGAVFTPTKKPGLYRLKEDGHNYLWTLEKGRVYAPTSEQKKVDKIYKKWKKEDTAKWAKTLPSNKNYRVDVLLPSVGSQKAEWISSDLMTKTQAEALARKKKKLGFRTAKAIKVKKKDLGYKELRKAGIKLNPNSDYDGDGVKNSKDCRPMNKNKQDLFDQAVSFGYSAGKAGTKFAQKKIYERSDKGRAEKAQAKIRKFEAKERAERFNKEQKIKARRLEQEAKQKEAKYKKEHPSLFTRVSKSIKERRARKKSIYD